MKRIRGRQERKEIILFLNDKIRGIVEEIRTNNYQPLSNTQGNKFLKLINGMVGIDKHITFHCARHTFATINKRLNE